MTSKQFVKAVYTEQKDLIDRYLKSGSATAVSGLIRELQLNKEQQAILRKILKGAFTDLCYTLLLGLDGEGQIGGVQHEYRLLDEKGRELGGGEIESHAWEYFHGNE